jgi:hypothetical protein
MWKRVFLGLALTLCLAAAGLWLTAWLTTPTPGVTPENFQRLRWGMGKSAVERLMGGPGDHRGGGHYCWERPGCDIWVHFGDEDTALEEAELYLNGPNEISASLHEPSLLDVLRREFGW